MTTGITAPSPSVTAERTGPITRITLGSGAKRNALTSRDWDAIARVVQDVDHDGTTGVILVRGRDGTFCAGSDMTEWEEAEPAAVEDSFARMETAFRAVEQCSVPVVAEIHGVAAGAGCQLALACDMRLLADSARLGMPIARLGINTSPAFAARMVALAGPATTRYLLYTGTLLDAQQAVAAGLADHHVPDGELAEFTTHTLDRIAAQPATALRAAKSAVSAALAPTRNATAHNDQPMVSPAEFSHGIARFLDRPRSRR